MTQHEAVRIARRRLLSLAITGSLAGLALLTAWFFASRGGAVAGLKPAALLLEFMLFFCVVFGALMLARVPLGGLPARLRRARRN
jgi:hypothetical protein